MWLVNPSVNAAFEKEHRQTDQANKKMIILPSFAHPQAVPKWHEFLSSV